MTTPEEWRSKFIYDIDVDIKVFIKEIQNDAYNQALDDLINELEKSSLPVQIKETISQMAQMIKK